MYGSHFHLRNDGERLAPGVVLSEGARGRGGDAPVGVRLPRNLPVVLADVLVLDLGVSGQVDSHCGESVIEQGRIRPRYLPLQVG